MSKDLVHDKRARQLGNEGTKKTIREGALDNDTVLREDEEVTVYSRQVPADKVYAHGAGTDDRNKGRSAYAYADIRAGGEGTGTAADVVTGDLVAVITDSEQRDVHARYEIGDLQSLSDAQSENRSERPLQPVVVPIAREDQHIELRIIADANSDGVQIDDGTDQATDVRLYFTDISV